MNIRHLIFILMALFLISIFINRKTLFPIKESVVCRKKCPAAQYGMSQPDANYCWSNRGRNKWCRPTNLRGNNVDEYKKWACNNCSECKQHAGGPWEKHLIDPVRCAKNKWSPWYKGRKKKDRERKASNWCKDYHKKLEKKKYHVRKQAKGCKKYIAKRYEGKKNCKTVWFQRKCTYYSRGLCGI